MKIPDSIPSYIPFLRFIRDRLYVIPFHFIVDRFKARPKHKTTSSMITIDTSHNNNNRHIDTNIKSVCVCVCLLTLL